MGALWQTVKWAGGNIADDFGKGGLAAYGKRAAQGAGIGALLGGTSEWSQGGSFWSGAKSGMWTGAEWGAIARGVRAGSGAVEWRNMGKAYSGAHGVFKEAYGAGKSGGFSRLNNEASLAAISGELEKGTMSKQLKAIVNNDAMSRVSGGVIGAHNSGANAYKHA